MPLSIEEVVLLSMNAGFRFFDADRMTFLRIRVHSRVYEGNGGIYFVTSESPRLTCGTGPRRYAIRRFLPKTGEVKTMEYVSSRLLAHSTAARIARGFTM